MHTFRTPLWLTTFARTFGDVEWFIRRVLFPIGRASTANPSPRQNTYSESRRSVVSRSAVLPGAAATCSVAQRICGHRSDTWAAQQSRHCFIRDVAAMAAVWCGSHSSTVYSTVYWQVLPDDLSRIFSDECAATDRLGRVGTHSSIVPRRLRVDGQPVHGGIVQRWLIGALRLPRVPAHGGRDGVGGKHRGYQTVWPLGSRAIHVVRQAVSLTLSI